MSSRCGRGRWELAARVRRAEDYAVLGALVVELHTESHAAKPTTRAWAITRRADRASRPDRPHQLEERGMVADGR